MRGIARANIRGPTCAVHRGATGGCLRGVRGDVHIKRWTSARCRAHRSISHMRRPFYDLYEAHKSAVTKEALERIAAPYAIEGEIRGRSAEERRAAWNERS